MLKRYAEALAAIREGLQRAPDIVFSHVWLAAALVRLGKQAEARDAVAAALRLVPDITIRRWPIFARYQSASDAMHMIEALREAGFP